jgi:bifunctional polynucleotide phosphatase/kinase
MAPIIELLHAPRFRQKMAAFDYDWTLVRPESGNTFARGRDDWRWMQPSVPGDLKNFYDAGYFIAVFTNQTKAFKREQVLKVLGDLNIPMAVCIGVEKADQKPGVAMMDALTARIAGKKEWKLSASFFVGDAMGRRGDWSDVDKVFAETVGFGKIRVPEDLFKPAAPAVASTSAAAAAPAAAPPLPEALSVAPPGQREVVIMIGFPGSGKSTIATGLFGADERYEVLHGDHYKTPKKLAQAASAALAAGKSPVVDATNPSREKRAVYIALAREAGVPARCVHVATSREDAYSRNVARVEAKVVPRIAYAVYNKHFVAPDAEAEGCAVARV